jgi:hypothetical protein
MEPNNEKVNSILYTIAVVLLILWLLGLVTSYTLGGFVHILLVVAVLVDPRQPHQRAPLGMTADLSDDTVINGAPYDASEATQRSAADVATPADTPDVPNLEEIKRRQIRLTMRYVAARDEVELGAGENIDLDSFILLGWSSW